MAEFMRITKKNIGFCEGGLSEEIRKRAASEQDVVLFGAVEDGTACGVMGVKFGEDEEADIIYLNVAEKHRRKGIGRGLIQYFYRQAQRNVWPMRCFFTAENADSPLYSFFAAQPYAFVEEEDGYVCRIPFAKLTEQKSLMAAKDHIKEPVGFFSLPELEQREFCKKLEDSGVFYLQSLYSWKNSCVPELCLCSKKDGKLSAVIFVQQHEGGNLDLAYVWSAPGCQTALFSLMAQAAASVEQRGEGFLYITAVEPVVEQIIEKMFPERETVQRFYCANWEL